MTYLNGTLIYYDDKRALKSLGNILFDTIEYKKKMSSLQRFSGVSFTSRTTFGVEEEIKYEGDLLTLINN